MVLLESSVPFDTAHPSSSCTPPSRCKQLKVCRPALSTQRVTTNFLFSKSLCNLARMDECPPCSFWSALCSISLALQNILCRSEGPCLAPRLLFFLITWPGIDTTSLLLLSTSYSFLDILKHHPHEQQTMLASQHLLHSGHCCFEDVSQSSKISVLFMSAINSFDFSRNVLISFVSA